ncbi:hypothetical protein [Cryobacterium sp. 10C3]|nr:hypothetical protein [Cryobacterium sp. 10C3]MDY7557345.1 hypothetical protein [Cryobacterium sp. 10C3]
MIVAITLTLYAITLSVAAPPLLLRANWVDRAPGWLSQPGRP